MLSGKVSSLRIMVIFTGLLAMTLPAWGEALKTAQTGKVAVVDGVPVYRDEFNVEALMLQKTLLGFGKPLTCSQVVSVREEVLESLIRRELLYQESSKLGIKPDEKTVDKELKSLRQQFPSEEDYKKELSRRGISEEILRSRLERNNAVGQYIVRLASNVTVTDSDMVNYYETHLDAFKQPLQVRVSHILVRSEPSWDAARKQEARQKAEQIVKELKSGKDFAALAKKESDGPTKASGGDLGFIRKGQLDKKIEDVVFGLKLGETSGIVEMGYGFNIFKVVDRKPETVLAYDAVKDKIRQYLVQEKAKKEAELQADGLRKKAKVQILMSEETCSAKRH